LAVGVLLVESQLGFQKLLLLGCNIGYRNWIQNFPEGIAVSMPAKNGNEQMESLCMGNLHW
jgi:hypothetical protein